MADPAKAWLDADGHPLPPHEAAVAIVAVYRPSMRPATAELLREAIEEWGSMWGDLCISSAMGR
jgi:hypothetical protein